MPDTSPDETVRAALQISHARLRKQHELVVNFGVGSLHATDIDALLTQACATVAEGMRTPYAKILTPLPDAEQFLLSHGVGWDAQDIGSATVGADEASPAGYAFMTDRPVISNHLGQENRFRTPALLKRYQIRRAINVPIRGPSSPYGVLEADSGDDTDFIESDLVFMEGIANVIAMAVERMATREDEAHSLPYSESVLNASPDCVKILSPCGTIEFFNEPGLCRMQLDSAEQVTGLNWIELWPDDAKPTVLNAMQRLVMGESVRFESFCPTAKGEPKWWDVTAAPIYDKQHNIEKIIAISRDVTERRNHEHQLMSLIDAQTTQISESDLHLHEIHHRVKNSLQLVNTLLLLQANVAVEETVKLQLQTAANRVLAIAAVHERLYLEDNCHEASVSEYLHALVGDIGKAFDDRTLQLSVEPTSIRSERLAPLGLVICELVTNALKYGKGDIVVRVEDVDAEAIEVIVIDGGDGFPLSYPKPNGTGLGMRLIRGYAGFGERAISVDRSAPTSKIHVRFKR
ncbi:sensor histidine kinase [Pseudomonas entomophila]|uniref:sensor histidine kinase n=1 Tax=Pseudomonas entomophila TaxID=312306 RepID=UPI003EBAEACA